MGWEGREEKRGTPSNSLQGLNILPYARDTGHTYYKLTICALLSSSSSSSLRLNMDFRQTFPSPQTQGCFPDKLIVRKDRKTVH